MVDDEIARYQTTRKSVAKARAVRIFFYHLAAYLLGNIFLGVCPRIRSWRRKPPRNNLLTVIWTLSWSN